MTWEASHVRWEGSQPLPVSSPGDQRPGAGQLWAGGRPPRRSRSSLDLQHQQDAPPGKAGGNRAARDAEVGVAEIQRIMQAEYAGTPKSTFLGVSPPVRSSGAANPLVQDHTWRRNMRHMSCASLQGLSEMDAALLSLLCSQNTPPLGGAASRFPIPRPPSAAPTDTDDDDILFAMETGAENSCASPVSCVTQF